MRASSAPIPAALWSNWDGPSGETSRAVLATVAIVQRWKEYTRADVFEALARLCHPRRRTTPAPSKPASSQTLPNEASFRFWATRRRPTPQSPRALANSPSRPPRFHPLAATSVLALAAPHARPGPRSLCAAPCRAPPSPPLSLPPLHARRGWHKVGTAFAVAVHGSPSPPLLPPSLPSPAPLPSPLRPRWGRTPSPPPTLPPAMYAITYSHT